MNTCSLNIIKKLLTIKQDQLFWTSSAHSRVRGKRAGKIRHDGYREIKINGTLFLEHRVVWALSRGAWPEKVIDHINGDPSDNRIENLRDVTRSENQRNGKRHRNGIPVGITFHKQIKKWQVTNQNTKKYIGVFKSLSAAKRIAASIHGAKK